MHLDSICRIGDNETDGFLDVSLTLSGFYRLEDAERMYDRVLTGYALGVDHISTLETVDELGILYRKQGRFVDAERLSNRIVTDPII